MLDSAAYYYKKTLEGNSIEKKYSSYLSLFYLEKKRGNYAQAIKDVSEMLILQDSINVMTQTEAIAKINSLYNYQHIEEENLQLKLAEEKDMKIILFFFSSTTVLLVLFLLLHIHHQSVTKQYRINKLKLKELQTKEQTPIAIYEKEIERLESSLKKDTKEEITPEKQMAYLQLQHLKLRNQEIQLSIEQQKLAIQTLRSTDIYKLFRRASVGEDVKTSDKHWQELQQELKKSVSKLYLASEKIIPKSNRCGNQNLLAI